MEVGVVCIIVLVVGACGVGLCVLCRDDGIGHRGMLWVVLGV